VLVQVRISGSKANSKNAQRLLPWSSIHLVLLILVFAVLTPLVPDQTR
jgi:hypothetical protein